MGIGTGTGALIGGVVSAAGGLAGSAMQSSAAGNAAQAQSQAATYAANLQAQQAANALAFQQQVWQQQQANQAPFIQAGQGAVGNLAYLMGTAPGAMPGAAAPPAAPPAAPGSTAPIQQAPPGQSMAITTRGDGTAPASQATPVARQTGQQGRNPQQGLTPQQIDQLTQQEGKAETGLGNIYGTKGLKFPGIGGQPGQLVMNPVNNATYQMQPDGTWNYISSPAALSADDKGNFSNVQILSPQQGQMINQAVQSQQPVAGQQQNINLSPQQVAGQSSVNPATGVSGSFTPPAQIPGAPGYTGPATGNLSSMVNPALGAAGSLMQPWTGTFQDPTQQWTQQFQDPTQQWTGGNFVAPTAEQAAATPGYQFALQQGQQALQRSAAAGGNLLTGGTMKALDQYSQGLASTNYQQTYNNAFQQYQQNYGQFQQQQQLNYGRALTGYQQSYGQFQNQQQSNYARALQAYQQSYNQFQQNQTNQYNRLANMAGMGQTATGQLGSAGTQAAAGMANTLLTSGQMQSQALQNAAAATAAGQIGGANAWGGAFGNIGNTAMQLGMMNTLAGMNQQQPQGNPIIGTNFG